MICKHVIDEQLNTFAQKEFAKCNNTPKKLKLSKGLIEKLFNHYECESVVENYYDDEPEIDDELYEMYFEYLFGNREELKEMLSTNGHTIEEYRDAYEKVIQLYEDYEERRMTFLSWQDVYAKGIWELTQNTVDKRARLVLNDVRKSSYKKKNRIYFEEDKEKGSLSIFICLRDIKCVDYWLIFKKKDTR